MRKALTVIAAILVVALVLIGISQYLKEQEKPTTPPTAAPPSPTTPVQQPSWCPQVEFIAIPGTWESEPNDDPIHPRKQPSYMSTITKPLQERFAPDRVKVWTLPYSAQFKNITNLDQLSYDDSRNEGTNKVSQELSATHQQCPLTDFIISGFSQGAVISGDIASAIGAGDGVIPPERVRGVALIADGRREPGVGQTVGNPVNGIGAEIALQPLGGVIQPIVPGASMRGPRVGGFGQLNDKTFQICAPDDAVCDAPKDIGNAVDRAMAMISANGVHGQYGVNNNVIPGMLVNTWVIDWATKLINAR